VLRRQMEVYAGFMEYTDHHVGRLLDGLRKLNILDDTLVYFADDPRGGGTTRANLCEWRAAEAYRRRQHAVFVQRRQGVGAA
jgi:arylsulfatase A-like enzyme